MPLSPDEVKRRTDAIEAALKDGFGPFKELGGRGSSVEEAARRLGNVKKQTLVGQLNDGTLTPDWKLYQPPPVEASEGYKVTGRSTLYDQDGKPILEWVKTSADQQRQEAMFRAALEGMKSKLPRAKSTPAPKRCAEDLMAFYPVGDHHMGLLAWHEETGADYDLSISEALLISAFDHFIETVRPCDSAVIALMGDFLHYDTFESVTPTNKNQLDSDTRYPKMVRAATRCLRHVVKSALHRHNHVTVVFEPGNHDPVSTVWLTEMFAALFENEPRVTVDTSPRNVHYVRFGKSLIGTHHGDTFKMNNLPLVMASDRPEDWGQTVFRYWWTGHIHHDTAKDIEGVRVESVRILAPQDAWASKRFRSMRDMKAVVYHKEYGEVERHTFNPAMLDAK